MGYPVFSWPVVIKNTYIEKDRDSSKENLPVETVISYTKTESHTKHTEDRGQRRNSSIHGFKGPLSIHKDHLSPYLLCWLLVEPRRRKQKRPHKF